MSREVKLARRGTTRDAEPRHVVAIVKESLRRRNGHKIRNGSLNGETDVVPDEAKRCRSFVTGANYLS